MVLARLIARVRERTGHHLYRYLRSRLSSAQQVAVEDVRSTSSTRVSAPALVAALRQLPGYPAVSLGPTTRMAWARCTR